MDRAVIRRRTQEALQKISEATALIAAKLELGESAAEILNIDNLPKARNDQTIREVYRVESFAQLLELIAEKVDGKYGTEHDDGGSGETGTGSSGTGTGPSDTGARSGDGTGDGSGRGVEPGDTGSAAANRIEDIEAKLIESGLTRTQIGLIRDAGYVSMDDIYDASEEQLEELGRVKGIGPYTVGVLRGLSR